MNRQQRRHHAPVQRLDAQRALHIVLQERMALRNSLLLCQPDPAKRTEINAAFDLDEQDMRLAVLQGTFFQKFRPATITHQGRAYQVAV